MKDNVKDEIRIVKTGQKYERYKWQKRHEG